MPERLTTRDVEKIAELAHLELTAEETEHFTPQLAQILEYAERLQEVDTSGVATAPSQSAESGLRADEPRPSLSNEDALGNAPSPGPGGLFRVPKVLGS